MKAKSVICILSVVATIALFIAVAFLVRHNGLIGNNFLSLGPITLPMISGAQGGFYFGSIWIPFGIVAALLVFYAIIFYGGKILGIMIAICAIILAILFIGAMLQSGNWFFVLLGLAAVGGIAYVLFFNVYDLTH